MIYLAAVCVLLVAVLVWALRGAAQERRELYQRIQAPEAAVIESLPRREGIGFVPVDDDDAHWANRQELSVHN